MRYAQRFRRAVRSAGAFQRRHHRQAAYYAANVRTRRMQQNGFRWYRLELRKARWAAWMWRLEQEDAGD